MSTRIKKRTFTRIKKRVTKSKGWLLVAAACILVIGMTLDPGNNFSIDAAAYKPLLNTIAKGESGGNYNAHFGSPGNSSIRFTDMTIAEVLKWQSDFVNQGNVSSAVGKYQVIQPTLIDITGKLNIDHGEKFDEVLQDRIAIALIDRRGAVEYVNDRLSREEFAGNLAKEWAALPKINGPNPHESYYQGDGINKSNISADEVYTALDVLQKSAKKND